MSLKLFSGISALILVISMTTEPSFANSEDLKASAKTGFFNQGSVMDMRIPLEESEKPEMQYGPAQAMKIEEKKNAKKGDPSEQTDQINLLKDPRQESSEDARKLVEAAQPDKIPPGVDPQEYQLKQKWGDPKEEVFPAGVESSPKPYKAMLEAFKMGRDDLALQYAAQWIGYMDKLENFGRKVSAMASVVKLDPANAEEEVSAEALTNIDPAALNTFLEKRKAEKENAVVAEDLELSEKSKETINAFFGKDQNKSVMKALGAESPGVEKKVDPYAKLLNPALDPESRKMLIRSTLAGRLPSEPSGQVQALFFVRPSEQLSINVGKEVAKALSSSTLKVSLSIVPLSVDGVTNKDNADFLNQTGIPALLRDGSALGRSLKIDQFPALLFVSSSSDKVFLKAGIADAVFIEEVAHMIGGK